MDSWRADSDRGAHVPDLWDNLERALGAQASPVPDHPKRPSWQVCFARLGMFDAKPQIVTP
jgi:hypothetical protein